MYNIIICSDFFQERFYFGDQVLPLFETGIPLLKQRLQQLPNSEKVTYRDDILGFQLFLAGI